MATIHVDVVSAEEQIFSGEASFVALPGESGELGIMPRHTPLITRIKPGAVRIKRASDGADAAYRYITRIDTPKAGARCVTPDLYWIFLAFSNASSIVPTM